MEKFTWNTGKDAAIQVRSSGIYEKISQNERHERVYKHNGKASFSKPELKNWFNGGEYITDLPSGKRENFLGDTFHSSAAIIKDGNKDYIVVGTNAGTIEVIEDTHVSNSDHRSASTNELKVIVPTEELWNKYLPNADNPEELPDYVSASGIGLDDKLKLYGVDLTPAIFDDFTLFGFRRGGRGYVSINNDFLKDSSTDQTITKYDDSNKFNQSWSIPKKPR